MPNSMFHTNIPLGKINFSTFLQLSGKTWLHASPIFDLSWVYHCAGKIWPFPSNALIFSYLITKCEKFRYTSSSKLITIRTHIDIKHWNLTHWCQNWRAFQWCYWFPPFIAAAQVASNVSLFSNCLRMKDIYGS